MRGVDPTLRHMSWVCELNDRSSVYKLLRSMGIRLDNSSRVAWLISAEDAIHRVDVQDAVRPTRGRRALAVRPTFWGSLETE